MVMDFILKSIPIVVIKDDVKESSEYRSRRQDFPTPKSISQKGHNENSHVKHTAISNQK